MTLSLTALYSLKLSLTTSDSENCGRRREVAHVRGKAPR